MTFTVSDNEDGTGATVTITGSAPGDSHQIYKAAVDGELGGKTFTSRGTISGNGTLLLAGTGYFWAKCDTTNGGNTTTTGIVYAAARKLADPVYDRILTAAAARIASLTLVGNPPVQDLISLENVTNLPIPGIFVTLEDQAESDNSVLMQLDDLVYPVMVWIYDRSSKNNQRLRKPILTNRQRIARAFNAQRLPGVDEVWYCRVDWGAPCELETGNNGYAGAMLRLNFTTREPRGFGA